MWSTPVRARAAADRAQPDGAHLAAVLAHAGGEGAYLCSLEPGDGDVNAYSRFFDPVMGIAEDPATGTAAGPLAALLVRSGAAAEGTVVIEQGRALGGPSRIQVSVTGDQVTVSGSGLVVADGMIRLG